MISPEVGRSLLAAELTRGRKGDVEVIHAGDIAPLAAMPADAPDDLPSPDATTGVSMSR
jgi:hypothetical protein